MIHRRLVWALAGSLAATGLVASQFATAEARTIKEMMGENFSGLQVILTALITSDYAAVPERAEIIREHAAQLTHNPPATAKDDREQFLAYAYNLQKHAEDMKSISQTLLTQGGQAKAAGDTTTSTLQEALAAHYGGMVTMCVACHNRFQPHVTR
jgi:cytochrome c556